MGVVTKFSAHFACNILYFRSPLSTFLNLPLRYFWMLLLQKMLRSCMWCACRATTDGSETPESSHPATSMLSLPMTAQIPSVGSMTPPCSFVSSTMGVSAFVKLHCNFGYYKRPHLTDRARMAKNRASESMVEMVERKEQNRTRVASKRSLVVPLEKSITNFESKIKQGPEFVCTCCHRLMYKQSVVAYGRTKYTKAKKTTWKAKVTCTGDLYPNLLSPKICTMLILVHIMCHP